jgi:hypothetical protein
MGPIETLLRNGIKRIEKPENWCKGYYAKDINHTNVGERDPRAFKWCMVGTITAEFDTTIVPISHVVVFGFISDAIHKQTPAWDTSMLFKWNDDADRTHAEVLAVLLDAANMAKEQGQ